MVAVFVFSFRITNFDSEMLMMYLPVLVGLTLHLLKAVFFIKDKFPLHKTLKQDLTKRKERNQFI